MKVKFSSEQVEWLMSVTGTNNAQDAVDFFVDCMKKENINPGEIMKTIDLIMKRALLPPKGNR